ncbi:MarR family transcriptional regulator [Paenibacillus chondroitinus]|uniref:MarR family transcriptional regulator n=1 Tax=Paenibacillus chondroitinus TaxID=59842 RepID=A0ABU6DKW1_9BACL|nr:MULTISPECIES: MarR family transcriptional regulator [Paenibacillus]MCY9657134.1 MarR family transcriptional regulator [Paenibacillus anseongense]MEB4798417.1 MarR family transcriptional regulator [Paenibacillus chondroitinus]
MTEDALLEFRSDVQKFIRLFGMLEQSVTPCGFPLSVSQAYALQELENTTLSVSELAQRLNLERSSVSRLVDGLVKENLVSRDINEANRREMLLALTEKGSRIIGQVRNQSLSFYQTVLENVPDGDQAIIMEGFKKFNHALFQYRGKTR